MQVMQYAKVEPRVGGVALHYKKVATPPERWSTFDRFVDQAAAQHRGRRAARRGCTGVPRQ